MDPKKPQDQIVERLKQAENVLVTVSNNPSVDQLAACIGLTLILNKLGKHGTAVFSGEVPSTLEFLEPEKTIEKTTDSLRDFIISLDKSKADKLRYKVEDKVVKIFITPYRSSITEKDLNFSQGDFNVDAVIGLGVHNQNELDQAITAHGRILHDATVMTVNIQTGGELGSMNWVEPGASSLSELVVRLGTQLDKQILDSQIATALLTGIVAETERFSNAKTSPQTMSISAELMAAGANQQLVATKLAEPPAPPPEPAPAPQAAAAEPPAPPPPKPDDGTLEIEHAEDKPPMPEIRIDDSGSFQPASSEPESTPPAAPVNMPAKQDEPEESQPEPPETPSQTKSTEGPKMILEPPTLGGELSANSSPSPRSEDAEGLGLPSVDDGPLLDHDPAEHTEMPAVGHTIMPPSQKFAPPPPPLPTFDEVVSQTLPKPSFAPPPSPFSPPVSSAGPAFAPPPSSPLPPPVSPAGTTLTQLEQAVGSPHVAAQGAAAADQSVISSPDVESARNAVRQAINSAADSGPPQPVEALNAQSVDLPLHTETAVVGPPPAAGLPNPAASPSAIEPSYLNANSPPNGTLPPPPPVPPPMMPPPYPPA